MWPTFSRFWTRAAREKFKPDAKPVFLEAPLPEKVPEPVPLHRVLPPLDPTDITLASEMPNTFSPEEITMALAMLKGGMARPRETATRITRPARFQIAFREAREFAEVCLMLVPQAKVRGGDMYAGYMVFSIDRGVTPIPRPDFEYAMSEFLALNGGGRLVSSYVGCRIKPEHHKRMEEIRGAEIKKRLGMGLEELMTGNRG